MSIYTAEIIWSRKGAEFLKSKYHRLHRWEFDGGVSVPASASPRVVPAPWSDPSAVDPEEAFVASLSSCHMLWFLNFASKKGFIVERYQDRAEGVMEKNKLGKSAITFVDLKPVVQFSGENMPTKEEFMMLHHRAHESCFIANSVKTEVRLDPVMKIE